MLDGQRGDAAAPLDNEFAIEGLTPTPANETQTETHISTLNPNSVLGPGPLGGSSRALVLNGSTFTGAVVPGSGQHASAHPVSVRELSSAGERLTRSGKRVPPAQTRESCEVSVCRDQLAAMLDGERCNVRIRNQGPLDVAAQMREDVPMPAARRDNGRSRPIHKTLTECESRLHGGRRIEDAWIRDDAEEAGEDCLR